MVIVRPFLSADTEPVNRIMASCTRELRRVYVPNPNAESLSRRQSHSSRIVAVDRTETVVGVAECVGRDAVLYVQGIAVAPTHRRHGVAADLLSHSTRLAADAGHQALEIATIKETGNVEIFFRLGFLVIDERISERFLGQDGRHVTEVTLQRDVT